jgi:type VII secretion protein EccB
VPRGEPVGIPDAPDALPDPKALLGLPWSACTMRRSPGSAALASHVIVGGAPAGGQPLGGDALLVAAGTASDAIRYLLWRNHRLKVADPSVLAALGMSSARPVPVGQALLNTIAIGPDLKAAFVFNAGADGAVVAGETGKLGQVYRAGNEHFVLLDRGLVPVGEVMARLLLAGGGQAVDIPASEAGRLQPQDGARVEPAGFPVDVPPLRNTDTELPLVCASYRGVAAADGAMTTLELFDRPDARLSQASAELPSPRVGPDAVQLADRVLVPGGRGALVRVLPSPDSASTGTTRYLVVDQGIKYALPRQDTDTVQENLGYAGIEPTPVPPYLLALLPTGPPLDPRVATQFRSATGTTPGPQ